MDPSNPPGPPMTLGNMRALGVQRFVTKRRDRPYRSGRSPDWIKLKNPDAPASRIMEW